MGDGELGTGTFHTCTVLLVEGAQSWLLPGHTLCQAESGETGAVAQGCADDVVPHPVAGIIDVTRCAGLVPLSAPCPEKLSSLAVSLPYPGGRIIQSCRLPVGPFPEHGDVGSQLRRRQLQGISTIALKATVDRGSCADDGTFPATEDLLNLIFDAIWL